MSGVHAGGVHELRVQVWISAEQQAVQAKLATHAAI